MLGIPVRIPDSEELSGIGAAWAAGIACGLYDGKVFEVLKRTGYAPEMTPDVRDEKYAGWLDAVRRVRV
jgi:glycerol kinase